MDMNHQQRLLSPNRKGQPRRRTSSTSIDEKTQCPSCGQQQLTTVIVDHELRVSICSGCNRSYGIDDSLDAEVLELLLRDEDFCQNFHITAVTCNQCLNDDVYRFVVVEGPHTDRLSVMCMECSSCSDIPLTDWENEEPGYDVDGTWMEEELLDSLENEGGSLWNDGDSEDDHTTMSWKDIDRDNLPFSCHCGNNEVDCFQRHFDASGDLSMVTCLVCDNQKVVELFFGVECWHCGNSRKELFERHIDDYGRITHLCCFVCDKHLHLPGQPSPWKEADLEKLPYMRRPHNHLKYQTSSVAGEAGLGRTKIENLRDVKRGDHVAWQRQYVIWHHGIVVDVPNDAHTLTVIHNSGGVKKLDGHFASVRLETINVNPNKENFYRIDYPAVNSCPVEEVIQ